VTYQASKPDASLLQKIILLAQQRMTLHIGLLSFGLAGLTLQARKGLKKPQDIYFTASLLAGVAFVFTGKYVHPIPQYTYLVVLAPGLAYFAAASRRLLDSRVVRLALAMWVFFALAASASLVASSVMYEANVKQLAAYVKDNAAPGDYIMGESGLANAVSFWSGAPIPRDHVEFPSHRERLALGLNTEQDVEEALAGAKFIVVAGDIKHSVTDLDAFKRLGSACQPAGGIEPAYPQLNVSLVSCRT